MTKEEALIKVKEHYWFLRERPEWNNDKEVAVAAVQKNGWNLEYASNKLKNDKEIVLNAVQQWGGALQFASDELKNDKDIILTAVASDIDACDYSLLEGYQNFDDIAEKEGETFLFSCWNSDDDAIRLRVANHPNFLPTLEQLEIGLEDEGDEVQEIYRLRKDEWLAKIEENKLRNTV